MTTRRGFLKRIGAGIVGAVGVLVAGRAVAEPAVEALDIDIESGRLLITFDGVCARADISGLAHDKDFAVISTNRPDFTIRYSGDWGNPNDPEWLNSLTAADFPLKTGVENLPDHW